MTQRGETIERLIPEGEVWKFTYEVSHAPHYTIQLPCRTLVGIFSPVENVPRNPSRPFGADVDKVREHANHEYVTVTKHDRENTPFADNAHDDECIIPPNRVWLLNIPNPDVELDGFHAVMQLPNGTFISDLQRPDWKSNGTPEPHGLLKEQVLEKVRDPDVSYQAVPIHQSVFRPVD